MPPTEPTVLVVGGGGREHAIAWALSRSPSVSRVWVAPGNGGTSREPKVENVAAADDGAVVRLARELSVGLVVVGPEAPLERGLVDRLRSERIAVFGPTADAARLETSKSWAREFAVRHGIPHPAFEVADDADAAAAAVRRIGGRCVVKADGLASGKGVIVCDDEQAALEAVQAMMTDRHFGAAGRRAVVEERLDGRELSVMVATDGRGGYALFPPAQDYKRLADGDVGPNTGGMGSHAPAPSATPEVLAAARDRIIEPTLEGLAAERLTFVGCLYFGLILTTDGPKLIEYNARFGDPETEAQLPLVRDDLAEVLRAAAAGDVGGRFLLSMGGAAVCVVLASEGYPERPESGRQIRGLETAEAMPGVKVFHAGTRTVDGEVETSGGRVLAVTGVGVDTSTARGAAYSAIGPHGVHFDGMQHRSDIALGTSEPDRGAARVDVR